MEALRQEYEGLRTEYRAVLEQALRAKNSSESRAAVEGLLSLNRRMSSVATAMMDRVAKMEHSVDLDELRGHLSDELVRIQNETKSLQAKREERKVLEGIYSQYERKTAATSHQVTLYLGALFVGLLLVIVAILGSTWVTPAMPPLAAPALTASPGALG